MTYHNVCFSRLLNLIPIGLGTEPDTKFVTKDTRVMFEENYLCDIQKVSQHVPCLMAKWLLVGYRFFKEQPPIWHLVLLNIIKMAQQVWAITLIANTTANRTMASIYSYWPRTSLFSQVFSNTIIFRDNFSVTHTHNLQSQTNGIRNKATVTLRVLPTHKDEWMGMKNGFYFAN